MSADWVLSSSHWLPWISCCLIHSLNDKGVTCWLTMMSTHTQSYKFSVTPISSFMCQQSIGELPDTIECCTIRVKMGLTCMCTDVTAQQPRPGESLPAGGANAGQSVWADVHLQSPQAGVLFGAVFAEESWPGSCGRGLSLFFLLWGTDMSHDSCAFHPLARAIRVHGFRTRGVWGAPLIFLSTAAGIAAEAGRGAEVQGPCVGRGLCLGGWQVKGGENTQIPHQTCGEAGGSGVDWWEISKSIILQTNVC